MLFLFNEDILIYNYIIQQEINKDILEIYTTNINVFSAPKDIHLQKKYFWKDDTNI